MTPMTTTPAPRSRIVPSAQVAVAVLVTALVLGAAALTSTLVLGLVLAAAAVVLAWGWAGTLNLPTPRGTVGTIVVGGLALVGSVWVYQFLYESRLRDLLKFGAVRVGAASAMILYLGFCPSGGQPFIYFQF